MFFLQGHEFIQFLQQEYLPSLQVAPEIAQVSVCVSWLKVQCTGCDITTFVIVHRSCVTFFSSRTSKS